MMTAMEKGLLLIKEHEGGEFTEDMTDPGGPTRWGISLRFLQSICPEATRASIVEMTWPRAAHIYAGEFWKKYRYDLLPEEIAIKVFDASVLTGPHQIALCLQRACRACGRPVAEDGVLGPVTISACYRIPVALLLVALRCELAGFFRVLVQVKPALAVYLNGWLVNRAYA